MAAGQLIPNIHEHKKVGDDLDDIYIETVENATKMRGYLQHPAGNRREVFLRFYYPFTSLFYHTRNLRDMKDVSDDELGAIERWIDDEQKPTKHRMREGLRLFNSYQKLILGKEIIALHR